MSDKMHLNNSRINECCRRLAALLVELGFEGKRGYPIPRGGLHAAKHLKKYFPFEITNDPEYADFFIDDIIDTGKTMERFCDRFNERPFYALIDKTDNEDPYYSAGFIVFPWEGDEVGAIGDNITRILQFIGEDPKREGLVETPARFVKALNYWFDGYDKDPKDVLKVFEDGSENYDQMITVKNIPLYSKCEHHIADIFGTVTISYIPNGKIVGLSKMSRLVDIFARRLQVQERLTTQIAQAIEENLEPLGVGVLIKARHMCMESRGICQQGHHTITSALRGVIKSEPESRAEFLNLANGE